MDIDPGSCHSERMRAWVVRFVSMYVFNVVVLLAIGWFTTARVGWSALWAAVILTLATIFLKPLLSTLFRGAATGAARKAGIGEKVIEYAVVYAVALAIWVVTVLLSGSRADGFFGWVLPPLILLIGWIVYDRVDDRIEARAGGFYDAAASRIGGAPAAPSQGTPHPNPAAEAGRRELKDGLTDEQRRLLDDL